MTINDPHGDPPRISEATLWFVLPFFTGAVLLGAVNRIHHLGATVGTACFVALPLLAATAAALRPHHCETHA